MRGTAITISLAAVLALEGGADARVKLKEAVPVSKTVAAAVAPAKAETVKATAPSASSVSPAEYARLVAEAVERAVPAARLEIAVSAVLSAASFEAVREIVPILAAVDLATVDTPQIVSAMVRIAEAVRQTFMSKGAAMAVSMERVNSPTWYQMRLYDGGTALWAIAEKAKWFAERGDREKVDELYRYFLKVISNVEEKR